ncbi:MAG: ATP-dependent Clp protease adapter ClpS, partial [Halomonadaceae bacterium]
MPNLDSSCLTVLPVKAGMTRPDMPDDGDLAVVGAPPPRGQTPPGDVVVKKKDNTPQGFCF